MNIECAYTMANSKVRLQFLAMERSLRATGFDLALRVFPYDDQVFDLPKGSEWIRTPLHKWLTERKGPPDVLKYYCLTQSSYFFTDTDIVYLIDPRESLSELEASWSLTPSGTSHVIHSPEESSKFLEKQTSLWLQRIVNAGWFACDRAIYSEEKLLEILNDPKIANSISRRRKNKSG